MKVKTAIKKTMKSEIAKELNGYYLGSCFSEDMKKWTLHYYNPDKGSIINIHVDETGVDKGKEDQATKNLNEIDASKIKIGCKKAWKKTKNKVGNKSSKTLFVLHNRQGLKWNMSYILPGLKIHSFEVDAGTGKIVKDKEGSLVKK